MPAAVVWLLTDGGAGRAGGRIEEESSLATLRSLLAIEEKDLSEETKREAYVSYSVVHLSCSWVDGYSTNYVYIRLP